MKLYGVAFAVLLLPVLGVCASYLADTRRGVTLTVLASSALTGLAALILLGVTVAHAPEVHAVSLTFWSYGVSVTPFNAATSTVLASTFQLGLGYSASAVSATLALLVAVVVFLCEAHFQMQLRRDPRVGGMMRQLNLVSFGALALILAPSLFQLLVGFEVCGLTALLLVGSARTTVAGGAARRGYLIWRLGALSLLLATVFIYVKFSGAITAAAATNHKGTGSVPSGLSLASLGQIWIAASHGLAHGVGARTLTLAAVLILVAAAAASGLFPVHGLWRSLGSAPGSAGALLLAVVGTVVGAAVILDTYPLFTVAAGVLPALVVLASLAAVVAAVLAVTENRLRRLAIWIAASQAATALAALGLGSPAAAVAVLISSALTTAALLAITSSMSRDLRLDSLDQLGPAWLQVKSTIAVLLLALAAASGVMGLGTFFARSAVLAAALEGAGHGLPTPGVAIRVVAVVGVALVALLLAGAAGRVAITALRGRELEDAREARLLRRQLSQARHPRQMWAALTLTGLALISGLVSLPAVGFGVGAFLSARRDHSALPLSGLGLAISLVVPLVALALMAWLRRPSEQWAEEEEPQWHLWLDGAWLAQAVEAGVIGAPATAVRLFQLRALEPAADAATSAADRIFRVGTGERPVRLGWTLATAPAVLGVVLLSAAVIIWVASGHPGHLRLP